MGEPAILTLNVADGRAPDAMLRWVCGEAESVYRPAAAPFRRWYDAWVDVLARTHLRTAHGIAGVGKGHARPSSNHLRG